MLEIKFDVGNNIVETARRSGVPEYSCRNIAGLISYSRNQLPADIPAHFTRPGYEISVSPLFAFTMYADEENKNDLAVTAVTLQIENDHLKSHDAGRAFVEKLFSQFKNGKWRRHINEFCPAVSGRSSLLNEAGEINKLSGCALDPDYKMTQSEWLQMLAYTQHYEWVGDGVFADLSITYSDDSRGITYDIFLDFEDLTVKQRRDKEREAQARKEGDAKGWNTTARNLQSDKEAEARNKILEANAIKRGDRVLPRQ